MFDAKLDRTDSAVTEFSLRLVVPRLVRVGAIGHRKNVYR